MIKWLAGWLVLHIPARFHTYQIPNQPLKNFVRERKLITWLWKKVLED